MAAFAASNAFAENTPQEDLLGRVCTVLGESPELTPVATRGRAVVYKEELAAFLETMPSEHAAYFVNSDHVQKRLQQLTIERLVALDGLEAGLLNDPEHLGRTHSVVSGLFANEKRKEIMDVSNSDALEGRARELYLADPSRFSKSARYSFEHVLITNQERSDLESAKRMIEAHERLVSGESFSEIRLEYSEDRAQPEEGYAEAELSQWPDKFKQALSNTDPRGQIIGPFSTEMGWHLVKYEAKKAGGSLDWESDKQAIIQAVRQQEAAAAERRYIRNISAPAYTVDESVLQELREEFSQ
jgi:parvulin-like peptidyl-prolyl isomerase